MTIKRLFNKPTIYNVVKISISPKDEMCGYKKSLNEKYQTFPLKDLDTIEE